MKTTGAQGVRSVRVERDGAVTTVILARPHARNAVDGPTARALTDAFVDFDAEASASVAVLWGEGGTFCAGADLKAIGTERGNRIDDLAEGVAAPMGPTRLRLRKPVIAAIAGHAVAGGLELAIWCDLRVVEEDATFGVYCRRWGVPLIDGGTVRLPRLLGLSVALDLILTGRAVLADEALRLGLASRVVPRGTSRAAAEALARDLASLPQECLRNDRASAYDQHARSLDEALAHELDLGRASLASPELIDGLTRFRGGAGRHGAR